MGIGDAALGGPRVSIRRSDMSWQTDGDFVPPQSDQGVEMREGPNRTILQPAPSLSLAHRYG